jgi:hypothetical protein
LRIRGTAAGLGWDLVWSVRRCSERCRDAPSVLPAELAVAGAGRPQRAHAWRLICGGRCLRAEYLAQVRLRLNADFDGCRTRSHTRKYHRRPYAWSGCGVDRRRRRL